MIYLELYKPHLVSEFNLDSDSIVIGSKSDCGNIERKLIEKQLRQLMPWRKGPYNLFGLIKTNLQINLNFNR